MCFCYICIGDPVRVPQKAKKLVRFKISHLGTHCGFHKFVKKNVLCYSTAPCTFLFCIISHALRAPCESAWQSRAGLHAGPASRAGPAGRSALANL